ncbi:winged helix-turn-helix transcriptional regulator [Streptomyces diacarni]|uniref:ParB/RepB/Spo0J family partition protein n=1 Tax=Streptomyces diacarni TaxID=2800381 RepID=UPI003403AC3F
MHKEEVLSLKRNDGSIDPCVVTVSISSVIPADSPRLAGEDIEHARTLAQSEADLPPLVVHRDSGRIIDGMHRLQAALLRGQDRVEVRYFYGDEAEAFVMAVKLNIQHGLPLTLSDRTAAAARIVTIRPEWSDRAVAAATGLAAKTVAAVRRRSATADIPQSLTRIGRDGRVRPLSSAEGRRIAGALIRENPDASLREIAKAAGISPGTVLDVRRRLQRKEDPVPPRQRSVVLGSAERKRRAQEESLSERREAEPLADRQGLDAVLAVRRPQVAPRTPRDRQGHVQALSRDPSLRMTLAGRLLLRWFNAHLSVDGAGSGQQERIAGSVPPRWRQTVADLAYSCAEDWTRFARQLETAEEPVDGHDMSEPDGADAVLCPTDG